MPRITPFLWFDTQAETAARFYTGIFKNSRITQVARYGPGGPGPEGSVMTVAFELDGQPFVALNGGTIFQFTEAISFVVRCRTQTELDRYWDKLGAGGQPARCGWLKDQFGLSWQVVPTALEKLLDASDPPRAARVMQALLGMVKLDIAALQAAAADVPPTPRPKAAAKPPPRRDAGPPRTIDDYLARVPDGQRQALESLRRTIRELVPEAEEAFSYAMPAFRVKGRPLIAFAAAKTHCALYPMSGRAVAAFANELASFSTSKGTIRFTPERPLPQRLLRRIVQWRLAEMNR